MGAAGFTRPSILYNHGRHCQSRGEAFLVRPIGAKALTGDAACVNRGRITGNASPLRGHLPVRDQVSAAKEERR